MKLVGGPYDGREIPPPFVPFVEACATGTVQGDSVIVPYRRHTFYSYWPIPGWEIKELPADLSCGESTPILYWRCRNYFTDEQLTKVNDFINNQWDYIGATMQAYEERVDDLIDKFLPGAISTALKIASLTGLDERPVKEDS